MIAEIVILAGSLLILIAAIGVLRFDDTMARMHSLTKGSTLGLLAVLIGGAWAAQDPNSITFLVLAGALQVITSPVGANMLGRATYRAKGIPNRLDVVSLQPTDPIKDTPRPNTENNSEALDSL